MNTLKLVTLSLWHSSLWQSACDIQACDIQACDTQHCANFKHIKLKVYRAATMCLYIYLGVLVEHPGQFKLVLTLSTYYSLSTSVRGQGPWSLLVACAYISCPHIYCLLVAHCAHISCPPAHTYWQSLVVLCLRSPLRFGHKLCIPSTESTFPFQRQHKVCLLSAIKGLILQPSPNRIRVSLKN